MFFEPLAIGGAQGRDNIESIDTHLTVVVKVAAHELEYVIHQLIIVWHFVSDN